MLKERYAPTVSWIARNRRRFLVYLVIGLSALFILVQLFWPTTTLVPYSSIEHTSLGGSSKSDAITLLDKKFAAAQVGVYFNSSQTAFFKATSAELGVTSSNQERINAIDYPWFLRLLPGSIFWAHFISDSSVADLQYQRDQAALDSYINAKFNGTCHLDVRNGSAEVKNKVVQVVEAFSGGDCDLNEIRSKLLEAAPTTEGVRVNISGTETLPSVTTPDAQKLVDHVIDITKDGIAINDGKDSHKIPKELLISWLDFGIVGDKLDYSFSMSRAASYLTERIASVVEKPTGTMTITLKNFAEVSRDTGQSGVVFNEEKMLASMKDSLEKGEKKVAVEVDTIAPTVKYATSYSDPDAALSAVIKKYAVSHPGTYGVSVRELSGARRNASYRSTTVYTTASTYKMFVAYSVLLRIESGEFHWTDASQGGRNLSECFDDMIELSDNDCALNLMKKVGFKAATDDAHAIGAVHTSFLVTDDLKSTPEDESLLLGLLESKQILTQQTSRDRWIEAMKQNVYRKGIPAGIPSAVVADKVGFLDAYLHDAAIVYSPKGTYVLVIMTENSSWANIAELASQIEDAR